MGEEADSSERRGASRGVRLAIVILALGICSELIRGVVSHFWQDPLAMVVPWPIHMASGFILATLAYGMVQGRRFAPKAALIISSLTAAAHLSVAVGNQSALPIFVPLSLTLPLFLTLLGNPGSTRAALALSLSIILPAYLLWSTGRAGFERYRALRRIEEVALPGDSASSGPGGITVHLPTGWRTLRRGNGIVDWPHSELELIHPSSGAVGFVVINPDCDGEALANFQERSLAALASAGGNPVPVGLVRLPDGATELRVQIRRDGLQLESYELFMELPTRGSTAPEGRSGCLWLHCLSPPRHRASVREDCREMARTVARDANEVPL